VGATPSRLAPAGATPSRVGSGEASPSHDDEARDAGPSSLEEPETSLDLLPAVRPADGPDRALERLCLEGEYASAGPAGVVPLLQALGRTVATHTQAGYASLQEDPRFWTLVHLVQTLGRPSIAPPMSEADEQTEDDGAPLPTGSDAAPQLATLSRLRRDS
jgi:hypothetical protein